MSKDLPGDLIIVLVKRDMLMRYTSGVLTMKVVVFKLNTKQQISINRVTLIPTSEATIKTVNDRGEQESKPEGIEFSDLNGRITLQDFADNDNDEDSNAPDDDFKIDEEYEEEVANEIALEEKEGYIGNDDPDSQEDYFQNPIQQHETNVRDNNEAASTIIPNAKRGDNPTVAFTNTVTPGNKKCTQRKKKTTIDQDTLVEDDLNDNNPLVVEDTKLGVGPTCDDTAGDDAVDDESTTPRELESDLGPYWALAQSSYAYVLNTITSYSNIEA
jgi:hypothetical protein